MPRATPSSSRSGGARPATVPPATRMPTGGTGQIHEPPHPAAVEPAGEPVHPYDPNDVS